VVDGIVLDARMLVFGSSTPKAPHATSTFLFASASSASLHPSSTHVLTFPIIFPGPQWQSKSVSFAHPSVSTSFTKHVNAHGGSFKLSKTFWRGYKGCGLDHAVGKCAARRRIERRFRGGECRVPVCICMVIERAAGNGGRGNCSSANDGATSRRR
jgi:hypothetical protein